MERQTIQRTFDGRTYEFTALATTGAALEIVFVYADQPLSWWRKLRGLPPVRALTAQPVITYPAGVGRCAALDLREITPRPARSRWWRA